MAFQIVYYSSCRHRFLLLQACHHLLLGCFRIHSSSQPPQLEMECTVTQDDGGLSKGGLWGLSWGLHSVSSPNLSGKLSLLTSHQAASVYQLPGECCTCWQCPGAPSPLWCILFNLSPFAGRLWGQFLRFGHDGSHSCLCLWFSIKPASPRGASCCYGAIGTLHPSHLYCLFPSSFPLSDLPLR